MAAEMPSSAISRSQAMSTISSTSRSLIVPTSESNLPRSAQARTSSPPGKCRAPSGHAAVSFHVTWRRPSLADPAPPQRGRNEAGNSVHANTGWQVGVPKNLERGIRVCFGSFPSFRVELLAAELVRGILGGLPRFFPIAAILLCRPYRSDPVVSVLLYRNPVAADPG